VSFRVFPTNGSINGSLSVPSRFRVTKDGQVRILIPSPDALAGGVQIVGNTTGGQQDPVNTGVMLHITGLDGDDSRSYVDAVGGYAGFVGRRLNGTSANPTGVLANDEVTRFAANVYASDEGFGERGVGQLRWYASEKHYQHQQRWQSRVLDHSSRRISDTKKLLLSNSTGITMAEGKTITGTVSTATNLVSASNILTGTVTIDPTVVNRSTASVQTFTLTGLTTNHKIVITSATAFGYGLFISAAWASAADTLSVEIQNFRGNQDVDLPAKTITYFAWV
jgi:hypothetical protein